MQAPGQCSSASPEEKTVMNNGNKIKAAFFLTVICTILMLIEGAVEILEPEWWEAWEKYHFLEMFITLGLLASIGFLSVEFSAMRQANDSLEQKLKVASGSFNRLLEAHYDSWGLTPSEREVARLVLKGCSNAEIAEIRSAATGTIKAQTHAIYSKSGLSGKNQLMGFLLEELTDGDSLK